MNAAAHKDECPVAAGQVLKTLSNHATDFIAKPVKFKGTDNPRWLRAIHALLTRPTTREQLDEIAGCSNSPEVVRQLRSLFEGDGKKLLICERITFIDRDGRPCNPGVYALADAARKAIYAWLARRKREAVTIKQGELLC